MIRCARIAIFMSLPLSAAGCVTAGGAPTAAPGPQQVQVRTQINQPSRRGAGADRPPPAPAQLTAQQLTDACAMRLHDVSGYLLLYYTENQRLPKSLDELIPLADGDDEFSLVCPASGLPYVYAPEGLAAPGQSRGLLLYEATSAHGGIRWGMVADAAPPGAPLMTYVIPMSDALLLQYTGNAPDAASRLGR